MIRRVTAKAQRKRHAEISRQIAELEAMLKDADAEIRAMPPGPQRTALQESLRPLWEWHFGPPEPVKPRRATWDYSKWMAEATQQRDLEKKYRAAGRLDLAKKAKGRAIEAEKAAKLLK